ncbi:hypothetical protein TVAG_059710 [Trichomonas vaginalis G3]|uniref:Uncharacterized protein n=1 Tax=Trichomonas vaginalis (strain ATCC PRA-98 / G3) TaxID=412133 RepID=A2FB23_TRIV3|nr:hypothetical protein TVAGG3_0710350 [Trichomonas vaginalis G3]EAX97906.1 hypothetical protein TVAG_059710 [Trichomonas vaginalis G3]KAI5509857.1 hypothetical protein TVAGG3_0710350 [Trichomonas vaginalis G3]|eukprot:XP_001310836.1 hypothetical protein [Trichomonas vaginalis G3]
MPKWLQKATYFCKEVFNEQNEKEDGIKLFEKLLMRRNPYEAMIYIEVLEKYKEKEVIDKYISLYFDSFMEIPNIEMAQILSILFRFNTNLISKFADRMNKYMTDKFVNEWPEIIIEFGIPLIDQSLTEYKIQTDFVLGSIDPKFGIIVPRHAVLLAQALMKTSPEQNEEIISFIDEHISSVSEMNDMFTNSATITELFDSFLELAPQKFTKLLEQCLERSTTIDDDFPSKDDAIEAHSFIGTLIHLASHSTILKQVKEQKLFDKFVSKMSKIFEILPSLVTDLTIEDFWNFAKYFDDSLFNYFKNNNDMSFLTVLPEFLLTKKSDFFTKQLKNDLSLLKRKLNSKKQEAVFINLLLSLFEKESNEQITEIITKYKSTIHDTKTDAFLLSRITEYLKTTKNNNQNEQIKYEFIPGNKTSHNMTILNFYKNSISDNNIFKTFIKNIDIYDNGKLKDLNIDCDYLIKIINKNMSDGIFLFKMFNFIGSNMESFSNHIDKLYHYLQIVLFTFMNINHENFKNLSVFIKPICNILKTKSTENMNSLFLDILSKMQDLHSDDNNDIIKFYPMLGECISELPKINSQEIFEKTHQVLQKLLSGKKDEKAILAVLTSILSMTKHMDIQSNYVDLYASTLSSENFEISLQTFRILQKFIHIEMVRNILSDKFATMREIGKCLSVILLWKQNMPVDFSISYLLKSSLEFSFHSVAQNFLTSYVFYNVFSSNIENSLSVLLTYVNDAISSKSANKLKAVYNALIKLMKDKNKIAEKILGSLTQNKDFVSVVCDKNINEFSKLETNVLELLPQIPNCSICFENKFPENSKTNIVVAAQTLSKLFDISQFDSLRILSYFTKMEIKLLAKIKIEEKNEFLQVKLRQSFDSELGDWDKTKVNLSDNPDFIDSTYEIIPKPLIYSHHLYFDKAFKSLTDYNDEMTAAVSSMALQRGERSILRTFCDGLPRDRVPSQELFGIIKKLKNEVIPLTKSDEICQFVVISQVKQFIRSISKSKGIPDFVIKISPAEMTEVQNSFESISQKINNLTGKILPVKPNLIEKSNKCFMMNQDEENDIAEKNESQLLTFMLSCPIKDETELKFCYPLIRQILERNMKSFVAYSALYYLYKNNLISGKKLMTSLVPIARIPAEFSHLFAQFVNKENPSLESRIHPAFSFVIHPGKNKFVQLVLRKSNEERYKILIDKSQKDEFKETSYYERFCLQNIYPLLETHLQTDIIEISFKYSSLDANYLSVSALLYTGERINYLVTNQPFTTPENTTAAREITRIFGRSPSSLMRNQRLMYFDSEKLSDDCYLTRTDNLPFVKNESAVEFNSIQCFDNKKEYVEWMTQFAYNYAALSSILYVRNAETFNGHKALLDKRSANVSQLFMERSEKQNVMKVFDVKNVLIGPFRNAFISACDALSLKSVRMRMIGVCLLSDTKEDATKTEKKSHYLSLRNNDSDVLQERINNLITSTDTKPFSWFI